MPAGGEGGLLWLGGLLELPLYVHEEEGADPYRALSAIWFEADSELIVLLAFVAPDEAAGASARALRTAMDSPLAGAPRRPTRVRVATEALASELRETFADMLSIEVAPTPELDAILEEMAEEMARDAAPPSYLDGGRLPPALMAELFRYARDLHRAAPWRRVCEGAALRVDAPVLGIEDACLVVLGAAGLVRGFALFPSYFAYEIFESLDLEADGVDLGGDVLLLTFEPGSALADSMRAEVARHRWPLAGKRAYPVPERRQRDGTPGPLAARDVRTLSVCAAALGVFFGKDGALTLASPCMPAGVPVTETYFGPDISISLTFPYA